MAADSSGELFRTIHGSNLYGLAHENSDLDLYIVTTEDDGHAHQRVVDGIDSTTVGFTTFLRLALSGSHQSCEALFSTEKVYTAEGEVFRPMLESMRVTGADVFTKYERTIKKFCFLDEKRRRHAVRLAFNLRGLREEGRFDPKLASAELQAVRSLAAAFEGQELWNLLRDYSD